MDVASFPTTHPSSRVTTLVPARLDRLPWSRFHLMLVLALGVTWILDGLEVTLVGAVSGVLQDARTLGFTPAEIGFAATCYLVGAVGGSLIFGYLTDRYGRRLFFFVTLSIYLVGALLTAFAWDLWSFIAFRMITGAGIGGEYAAINSAIDELVPARLRGRIALYINGSYWLGAALGALSTLFFLNPDIFAEDLGWRVGFFVGALLSLVILLVRRHVPESLRWQITHGYCDEAETEMAAIEKRVAAECGPLPPPDETCAIVLRPQRHFGFGLILRAAIGEYRGRATLGLALMISQAFLYNAIFFTYALVLTQFYAVPSAQTGLYLLPFAAGNFLGVILLGHYFDTIGRRQMIAATYLASAVLLFVTGWLFAQDALTAVTLTAMWTLIFFFASPAASAAYLTVSEIFPLETRALAIAFFYSVGTGVGGVAAPWLFGTLIGTGSRLNVFYGYVFAAVLMIGAVVVTLIYGVAAERRPLEHVARPLAAGD